MALLHDEQGKLSLSRVLLVTTTGYILGLITFDVYCALRTGSAIWSILGTMESVFAMWAAGPRIAQYIGPQLGKIVEGLSAAKGTARFGGPAMTHYDGDK